MFTNEDLKKYNGFRKIIHSGSFNFKGDACSMAGVLFKWFEDLGLEIEKQSKEEGKMLSAKITESKENELGNS